MKKGKKLYEGKAKIIYATNEKNLNNLVSTLQNYLIVTSKKNSNNKQYLILDKLPIKFSKLIENLGILLDIDKSKIADL